MEIRSQFCFPRRTEAASEQCYITSSIETSRQKEVKFNCQATYLKKSFGEKRHDNVICSHSQQHGRAAPLWESISRFPRLSDPVELAAFLSSPKTLGEQTATRRTNSSNAKLLWRKNLNRREAKLGCITGLPNKACTWFCEVCSCSLSKGRNKVHQTTYKPYSGALYTNRKGGNMTVIHPSHHDQMDNPVYYGQGAWLTSRTYSHLYDMAEYKCHVLCAR